MTSQDIQEELNQFIDKNIKTNFPSIQSRRAQLAGQVTTSCNKAYKIKEEAFKKGTFKENEVKQNHSLIQEAIGSLKHFCESCIKMYASKMNIDVNEEYSLYFTKYSDKASKAMEAMESLLQHNQASKEKTPGGQSTIAREESDDPSSLSNDFDFSRAPGIDPTIASWRPKNAEVGPLGNAAATAIIGKGFDIDNFCRTKFSGQADYWPEFFLRWTLADDAMANVGLTFPQRFLLLLQKLEGAPLEYVRNLPPLEEESYARSIQTLSELYFSKTIRLKDLMYEFLTIPKCNPSFESRARWHSQAMAFFNALGSYSGEDLFVALTICSAEMKMDPQMLRDYTKRTMEKRDLSQPMGYKTSPKIFLDLCYDIMLVDHETEKSMYANKLQWRRPSHH